MLTTPDHIDKIIAKFAHLKSALELHGKDGTLSLHKQSELLMMHVLTLAYGYPLEFLGTDARFPGVDLGSEKAGIAIQITSRNDNEKVNDAIEKFLNHDLQKTFSRMIVLMMNTRISKYPLRSFSDPAFQFDTTKDIIDLNDLVQKIKTLMPIQIQTIADYLDKELPGVLSRATKNETYLIDVAADQAQRQLDYYFHSIVKIDFKGASLTAAKIYRWLTDYFNTNGKRFLFDIFYERYRKRTTSSNTVLFERPLAEHGASNQAKHVAFGITENKLQIEYANYYSKAERNSDLAEELGPMLSVLLALSALKKAPGTKIEVSFQYDTNGKLMFYNQNSPLAANTHMQVFYLDRPQLVKKEFDKVGDEELLELLQEIADTFINEPLPMQTNHPFMAFDREGQLQTLNFIRGHIQPTMGEITE